MRWVVSARLLQSWIRSSRGRRRACCAMGVGRSGATRTGQVRTCMYMLSCEWGAKSAAAGSFACGVSGTAAVGACCPEADLYLSADVVSGETMLDAVRRDALPRLMPHLAGRERDDGREPNVFRKKTAVISVCGGPLLVL